MWDLYHHQSCLRLSAESAEVLQVSELLGTRLLQLSDVIDEENPPFGFGFKGLNPKPTKPSEFGAGALKGGGLWGVGFRDV